ncbi:MAG: hypothetical protein RIC55_08025 [Pirellulaceae bacterium]
MATFDRFDIAEAHYLFLSEYHEGQGSERYARLSRLSRVFHPSPCWAGAASMNENAREIYAALVDRHEGGVDVWVSIYGDGALLDCTLDGDWGNLKHDDELDEQGDAQPTAIIALRGVPCAVALAAWDYCQGNQGSSPYSDGYEATECCAVAKESEVLECSVPWSCAECKRLGGCFLCGGDHSTK